MSTDGVWSEKLDEIEMTLMKHLEEFPGGIKSWCFKVHVENLKGTSMTSSNNSARFRTSRVYKEIFNRKEGEDGGNDTRPEGYLSEVPQDPEGYTGSGGKE